GSCHGVELALRVGQAGGGVEVIICTQREDQNLALVLAGVRGDASRLGIDRDDRLAPKPHAWFCQVAVGESDGVGCLAAKQDVELGEAEAERVAVVYQRHLDAVPERLRQHRRKLETAEAGAEDDDSTRHRGSIPPRGAAALAGELTIGRRERGARY